MAATQSRKKVSALRIKFKIDDERNQAVSSSDVIDINIQSTEDNVAPQKNSVQLFEHLITEDSETRLVSSTPKIFAAINEKDFNDDFYLSEEELDIYIEGFMLGIKENIGDVFTGLLNEGTTQKDLIESALDDIDIKLSLYRSFKSLNDKWISNSEVSGDLTSGYFFNNYGQKDSRTLFDHFKFINRANQDVGGLAVIDVSYLSNLSNTKNGQGPTQSLYQSLTNLLSKNNFDFWPLPSNTDLSVSSQSDDDIKDIFRPLDFYEEKPSGPTFNCVYVGGSSRTVSDLSGGEEYSCSTEKTNFDYNSDSFDITEETDWPEEFKKENEGLVVFKVRFGQEAQNHFSTVEIDQSEFKETQESLLVIDALTNPETGSSPNQIGKGNNIFDLYLTRSYNCKVSGLGNMSIQPLMYFKLENVPMFRGTYLIKDVKHTITAHNVKTEFTGMRQNRVTVPLVTDALSILDLTLSNVALDDETTSLANTNSINSSVRNVTLGQPSSGPVPITSKPISKKVVDNIEVLVGEKYASAGLFDTSKVTSVVLHWTGGWGFHPNPSTTVGYQFTIDTEGGLWETNPITNISSHAGCPSSKTGPCHGMNSKSVGISYVGGLKFHQKLGVPGIVDGVHNFPKNRQDNDTHGYAFTEEEWTKSEVYLPYKPKNGEARTLKVNPKAQWESIINAILLAKAAHPTITNIVSHHWVSTDKQDVRDSFPWAKLIAELKNRGFTEARIVADWPSTNRYGTGKTVYNKKLNIPENLFGPKAQEDQGNI